MDHINFCTRIFLEFRPHNFPTKWLGLPFRLRKNRWINQVADGWSFISREESSDESRNREHVLSCAFPLPQPIPRVEISNCYANAGMIIQKDRHPGSLYILRPKLKNGNEGHALLVPDSWKSPLVWKCDIRWVWINMRRAFLPRRVYIVSRTFQPRPSFSSRSRTSAVLHRRHRRSPFHPRDTPVQARTDCDSKVILFKVL